MYLQFHSVREPSMNHDIWVPDSSVIQGVWFSLGSVRFLAKTGFWFGSFSLDLGSFPYVVQINPQRQLKGSVKEPNKFHIYETEKITRKASDAAEYIELFSSFTRDRHARRI